MRERYPWHLWDIFHVFVRKMGHGKVPICMGNPFRQRAVSVGFLLWEVEWEGAMEDVMTHLKELIQKLTWREDLRLAKIKKRFAFAAPITRFLRPFNFSTPPPLAVDVVRIAAKSNPLEMCDPLKVREKVGHGEAGHISTEQRHYQYKECIITEGNIIRDEQFHLKSKVLGRYLCGFQMESPSPHQNSFKSRNVCSKYMHDVTYVCSIEFISKI